MGLGGLLSFHLTTSLTFYLFLFSLPRSCRRFSIGTSGVTASQTQGTEHLVSTLPGADSASPQALGLPATLPREHQACLIFSRCHSLSLDYSRNKYLHFCASMTLPFPSFLPPPFLTPLPSSFSTPLFSQCLGNSLLVLGVVLYWGTCDLVLLGTWENSTLSF